MLLCMCYEPSARYLPSTEEVPVAVGVVTQPVLTRQPRCRYVHIPTVVRSLRIVNDLTHYREMMHAFCGTHVSHDRGCWFLIKTSRLINLATNFTNFLLFRAKMESEAVYLKVPRPSTFWFCNIDLNFLGVEPDIWFSHLAVCTRRWGHHM